MARSRRRMRRSRPRAKADWVYRGPMGIPGDPSDNDWFIDQQLSTYSSVSAGLTAGRAGATGFILYDSNNRLATVANTYNTAGGFATAALMSRSARAEGRNPLCLRVQGTVLIRPNAWTLGSFAFIGMRIGVWEQDPESGSLLVSSDYTMMATTLYDWGSSPAVWANDRQWAWEDHVFRSFSDSTPSPGWTVRINVPMRRSLKPHQCLALYMEGSPASANVNVTRFLRTLVVDEG